MIPPTEPRIFEVMRSSLYDSLAFSILVLHDNQSFHLCSTSLCPRQKGRRSNYHYPQFAGSRHTMACPTVSHCQGQEGRQFPNQQNRTYLDRTLSAPVVYPLPSSGVGGVCLRWGLQVCLRKIESHLAFHGSSHVSSSRSCQDTGPTRLLLAKMGREVCCRADPSSGASWHVARAVCRSAYLPANREAWKDLSSGAQVPVFWLTIYNLGETTWSLCASVSRSLEQTYSHGIY